MIWRNNNPSKIKETNQRWYINNTEKAKKRAVEWKTTGDNIIKARKSVLKWASNHPEKIREGYKKQNDKRLSTPKGKLNSGMGRNISKALRENKRNRHWESLVDYTVSQLKEHLEKRFKDGMTWENYGTVWEIDHKIPKAVFNYERPEDIDFRLCWSLKNLQPLEKSENRMKQAKIDKPFQPSLCING